MPGRRNSTRSSRWIISLLTTAVILILAISHYLNTKGPTPQPLETGPAPEATGFSTAALPSTGKTPNWGHATKTSGCQASNSLQDTACTPGDILADATTDQICRSGYASSVRNVPASEKDQVYAEYGILSRSPGQYEVDHLVSLELGGSNDISNLWPEAASPKPGFHEKDKVENYLHDQVCSGKMSLADAQAQIATNWLQVYQSLP